MERGSCERCGATRWIPIVYGLPGEEMRIAAEQGRIGLGGCVVEEGSPHRRCRLCGKPEGAAPDWTGENGPIDGEFAEFHKPLSVTEIPAADDPGSVSFFALSFDNYAAFGEAAAGIAGRASTRFERDRRLPDNLAVLRCCLFMEQRGAHHRGDTLEGEYVASLVEAIRAFASAAGAS